MEGKRVRWPHLEASRRLHRGGEGCVDEGEGGGPSCHMSNSDRVVGEHVGGALPRMVVLKCLPFIWDIPNGGYRV